MSKEKRSVYQINIWCEELEGSVQLYCNTDGVWTLEENCELWGDDYRHLTKGTFTECVEYIRANFDMEANR